MTYRIGSLLALVSLLSGCPAPTSQPLFDTGTDTGALDDGGRDAASTSDTGIDAASTSDTGVDAASTSDTGVDAASTSDAGTSAPEHLVFSEIGVAPAGGEFFEIWNPTSAAIDLTTYYVSDNAVYYGIAAGTAWNPVTSNPGTDFLFGFPAGATIAAGAVIVIATDATFETTYSRCPDYILASVPHTCTSGTAAAVRVPTNGGVDDTKHGALLSNDREMLVLFRWDPTTTSVRDVDYVTWGTTFDAGATRVDKTGITPYVADTAAASQHAASAPPSGQSIVRCGGEVGETATGGNGMTGHDETSEHLDTAFGVVTAPTPGVHGGCT